MNVAAGGTLLQHLPESHGHHEHRRNPGSFDGADHDVRLARRLAGRARRRRGRPRHEVPPPPGRRPRRRGLRGHRLVVDRRAARGLRGARPPLRARRPVAPRGRRAEPPHRRARGRGRRRAQRLSADVPRRRRRSAARRTVIVALAANASIAVAKLVAGVASGSSAMLAEAAHSIADTMNQVFLLFSLALGERPPDAEHPFGHGKERFFWSFLAAVGIFVAGAGFSLYEGLHRIFGPRRGARLVTASSTPSSASRLPGRRRVARARVAPDAPRGERAPPAVRELRARQPRPDDQDGPLRGLGGRHRRRRWPSPASRCTRPPATRSTTAWPRSSSACCWRWSPWPSAATPRTLLIGEAATPEERKAITEIIEAHPGRRPRCSSC